MKIKIGLTGATGNLGKTILKNNKLHLIGKLKISEWNNKEQVQMHIMDVIKL